MNGLTGIYDCTNESAEVVSSASSFVFTLTDSKAASAARSSNVGKPAF